MKLIGQAALKDLQVASRYPSLSAIHSVDGHTSLSSRITVAHLTVPSRNIELLMFLGAMPFPQEDSERDEFPTWLDVN